MVQGSSIPGHRFVGFIPLNLHSLICVHPWFLVGSIPINLPSPPSNRDPENGGMAWWQWYIISTFLPACPGLVIFPSLWFPVNSRRSHPYVTSRNLWTMCNHLLQLFALSQRFPKQALQVTHVPPHYGIEHFGRDPLKWWKKVDLSSPGRYREYRF